MRQAHWKEPVSVLIQSPLFRLRYRLHVSSSSLVSLQTYSLDIVFPVSPARVDTSCQGWTAFLALVPTQGSAQVPTLLA